LPVADTRPSIRIFQNTPAGAERKSTADLSTFTDKDSRAHMVWGVHQRFAMLYGS
jgi:hypothetical protein